MTKSPIFHSQSIISLLTPFVNLQILVKPLLAPTESRVLSSFLRFCFAYTTVTYFLHSFARKRAYTLYFDAYKKTVFFACFFDFFAFYRPRGGFKKNLLRVEYCIRFFQKKVKEEEKEREKSIDFSHSFVFFIALFLKTFF